MEAVDLVYLWVDGNDQKWLEKRNSFLDESIKKASITGRYENNDELKYSLRSIEKNLPWIRKIFIITDNQVPNFIDINNTKIQIINHEEIIPKEILPIFNSVVIEYFLHNIPNLSEKFLLASDDCFVNKNLTPDFFFKNDLPIVRMIKSPTLKMKIFFKRLMKVKVDNYKLSIENAYKLIDKKYKKYYPVRPHHNIDAFLKSEYKRTFQTFENDLKKVYHNRFRNATDIQRILFQYDLLARNRGYLHYITNEDSYLIQVHFDDFSKYISRYNPTLFCLNETEKSTNEDRKRIVPFLKKLFPTKSKFEK